MKTQPVFVILTTLALLTACGGQPGSATETALPISATDFQEGGDTAISTLLSIETAAPNCLGDEINPIGQSIADDYDFSSYEQVMTWFCNGAEFEDILVALETQSQTGVPADETLQMLADGFTWEEIWQVIGISD